MGKRPESEPVRLRGKVATLLVLVAWLTLSIPLVRNLLGQFHLQQGQEPARSGSHAQARDEFLVAARYQPDDPEIRMAQGWLHLQMAMRLPGLLGRSQADQAEGYFRRAGELSPLEPDTHYGLARALALQGEGGLAEAVDADRLALKLWPNNHLYLEFLAGMLDDLDRQTELLVALERLGRVYPGSYQRVRRRLYWQKEPARRAFRRGLAEAICAGIDAPKAHLALAEIRAADGDWLGAANDYRQALGRGGRQDSPAASYRLGGYLLRGGAIKEAETAFADGLAGSGKPEDDLAALSRIYNDAGRIEDYASFLKRMRDRFQPGLVREIRLAENLLEFDRLEEAKGILSHWAGSDQKLAQPFHLLSRIAERQGDWPGMEEMARQAMARSERSPEYHLQLARALEKRNRYAEALDEVERAISLSSSPAEELLKLRERMQGKLRMREEKGR